MKLSKIQREQVVELLRCAADVVQFDVTQGLYGVAHLIGLPTWDVEVDSHCACCAKLVEERIDFIHRTAVNARSAMPWMPYMNQLLEAAALVEEGSWP